MKRKLNALTTGIISLIACLLLFIGCTPSPKTFEKAGMQITLTGSFYEKDIASMTAYYESRTSIVTALKEEFTLADGFENYTLSQYSGLVLKGNKLTATVHEREGKEYQYFSYEKSVNGKEFYYLATTHKASDAFWLIQFGCVVSDKDKFENVFFDWADTVTFQSSATL